MKLAQLIKLKHDVEFLDKSAPEYHCARIRSADTHYICLLNQKTEQILRDYGEEWVFIGIVKDNKTDGYIPGELLSRIKQAHFRIRNRFTPELQNRLLIEEEEAKRIETEWKKQQEKNYTESQILELINRKKINVQKNGYRYLFEIYLDNIQTLEGLKDLIANELECETMQIKKIKEVEIDSDIKKIKFNDIIHVEIDLDSLEFI